MHGDPPGGSCWPAILVGPVEAMRQRNLALWTKFPWFCAMLRRRIKLYAATAPACLPRRLNLVLPDGVAERPSHRRQERVIRGRTIVAKHRPADLRQDVATGDRAEMR
jgi:hypothetical protein